MYLADPKVPYTSDEKSREFGVYPAIVVDLRDPHDQGRVKIELPWIAEEDVPQAHTWARLTTMNAGAARGSWFIPEVGDEVLVSFVAGNTRWPIIIGTLWNGVDTPPETMDPGGENNVRSFTSRSGHKLTFDDTGGAESVKVETQGGHTLKLDDGNGGVITLQHSGGSVIEIDASGTISITATNQVNVDAPAGLNVTAAMVNVDAAMSKFTGVVKAETIITNAVVSSTYTPGAGNIW